MSRGDPRLPKTDAEWKYAEEHRPKFMAWLEADKKLKAISAANHKKRWAQSEGRGEGPDEAAWDAAMAALTKAHKEMLEETAAMEKAEEEKEAAKKAAIEQRKAAAAAKKAEQKKGGKRKTRRRRTARK